MAREGLSYAIKVMAAFAVLLTLGLSVPVPTATLFGAPFLMGLAALFTDRILSDTFQGWPRWGAEAVVDATLLVAANGLGVGLPLGPALATAAAVAAVDLSAHRFLLLLGVRLRRSGRRFRRHAR
jgi:hypothetical protein